MNIAEKTVEKTVFFSLDYLLTLWYNRLKDEKRKRKSEDYSDDFDQGKICYTCNDRFGGK